MARPQSEIRLKVVEQLERQPATALDVAVAHGMSLDITLKLLSRLLYSKQVMVVDKIARAGCKRKVAVYQAKRAA